MTEFYQKIEEPIRLLKLLANDKRLLILCQLAQSGEMSVNTLADSIQLGQSALSQHLAKMRAEGLVKYRREAQTLHYSIGDPNVAKILMLLKELYC
ncbi:MAG: metalloregulator ArsR/SmtB family transcription factor [Stappiaceae bacterium]